MVHQLCTFSAIKQWWSGYMKCRTRFCTFLPNDKQSKWCTNFVPLHQLNSEGQEIWNAALDFVPFTKWLAVQMVHQFCTFSPIKQWWSGNMKYSTKFCTFHQMINSWNGDKFCTFSPIKQWWPGNIKGRTKFCTFHQIINSLNTTSYFSFRLCFYLLSNFETFTQCIND